jgi:hypothetical protein
VPSTPTGAGGQTTPSRNTATKHKSSKKKKKKATRKHRAKHHRTARGHRKASKRTSDQRNTHKRRPGQRVGLELKPTPAGADRIWALDDRDGVRRPSRVFARWSSLTAVE